MAHRLMLALGCATIDELDARIGVEDFLWWRAYFMAEPWSAGDAMLASMIANALRDSKKNPDPLVPADFMPALMESQKEKRAEQQKRRDLESIFPGITDGKYRDTDG